MPSKTESGRRPAARGAIASLFILALLAPARLAAEERAAYVDLAAAGLGAATGALHLRGGLEFPMTGPWSAALEAGAYAGGSKDMLSLQADLAGGARWRPAGPRGLFAGAGAGIAAALASDAPWAPDPAGSASHSLVGLKVFVLAEAGWAFGKASSKIRVEPYVRSVFAIGPEILQGTAAGTRQGTEWGSAFSVSLGFRLAWTPPAWRGKKGDSQRQP